MRRLRIVFIVTASLVAVASAFAQDEPKEHSIAWYVWDAHRRGVTETQVAEGQVQTTGNFRLEMALTHTTLVLAQPLGEVVNHDERSITTFRKYRTVEILSVQKRAISVPFPEAVPASLLPLKDDEFVVPLLGGTLIVDGVTLSEDTIDGGPVRTPPSGKQQLMFITFICKGYALLNYNDRGLFWVDDDGETIHVMQEATLSIDVHARSGNNLSTLRTVSRELASSLQKQDDQQ